MKLIPCSFGRRCAVIKQFIVQFNPETSSHILRLRSESKAVASSHIIYTKPILKSSLLIAQALQLLAVGSEKALAKNLNIDTSAEKRKIVTGLSHTRDLELFASLTLSLICLLISLKYYPQKSRPFARYIELWISKRPGELTVWSFSARASSWLAIVAIPASRTVFISST